MSGRNFLRRAGLESGVRAILPWFLVLLLACSSVPSAPAGGGDAAEPADSGTADAGIGVDAGATSECVPASSADPLAVVTDRGTVIGASQGAVEAFLGIPFAAPPVGNLRWRAPEPAPCWSDVRPARAFGPACPQLQQGQPRGDEDCLQLNVWRPAARTSPLPVMVFLHGGGNIQGSTSESAAGGVLLYDGARLSENGGVIVVTANYRLGVFGFLTHSDLAAENSHAASGNYGILDQIAALEWVQRNISSFGGDPARVMVFGESAGARDVCVLLASPLARGLFSAAGMQSGGCGESPASEREAEGLEVARLAGCDGAGCLRALDTDTVLRLKPGMVDVATGRDTDYGANVDGWILPDQPLSVMEAGEHNAVPLLIGSNEDETARSVGQIADCAVYERAVREFLPLISAPVLAAYPCTDYPSPRAAFVALTSDLRFTCPIGRIARALSPHAPVYRYFFTQELENARVPLGAYHGLELPFVFGHLDIGNYVPSQGERDLSTAMQRWWSTFAATGTPGTASGVDWPLWNAATDAHLQLQVPPTPANGVRTEQCTFWDTILP